MEQVVRREASIVEYYASISLSGSRRAQHPPYPVIATPAPNNKPGKGSIHGEISPGTPYTMPLNKVLTERRERLEKE